MSLQVRSSRQFCASSATVELLYPTFGLLVQLSPGRSPEQAMATLAEISRAAASGPQLWASSHRGHSEPPQSTPVSSRFNSWSVQLGQASQESGQASAAVRYVTPISCSLRPPGGRAIRGD